MKTKRMTALTLAWAMLAALLLTGCFGSRQSLSQAEELTAENLALQARIAELESQTAAPVDPTGPEGTGANSYALAINALLYSGGGDGAAEIAFMDRLALTARAILPAGKALAGWRVNGETLAQQEQEITLEAVGNTVVEAVLRDELTVTAVQATMQFLGGDGRPEGEKFNQYVFEYDTDRVTAGTITVYVAADVPAGYEIDHWLINGVPYYYNRVVTGFTVWDLDATTEYELVLRRIGATPTPAPSRTPAPTAAPTATPVPTPTPQMVTINCNNCSFSGGGYTNATGGTVPKGSVLTLVGTTDVGNPTAWEINGVSDSDYFSKKTITYTVNEDTLFKYTGFN